MSASFLNKSTSAGKKTAAWWTRLIAISLWVVVGFAAAQLILTGFILLLDHLGVPLRAYNQALLNTMFAASVYLLTLIIVLGVPWWLKKRSTTKAELGLTRLPSWLDIGLSLPAFFLYFLLTAILSLAAVALIPGYDGAQPQEIGFNQLTNYTEYTLAFLTLVILAPLAEEVIFRGYLYGKLRKTASIWLALPITSLLFAVVHGQLNVGIDVFALSVVLCSLREITGSIWAGVLLHMLKNGLAFYLLFINPSLSNIMGG